MCLHLLILSESKIFNWSQSNIYLCVPMSFQLHNVITMLIRTYFMFMTQWKVHFMTNTDNVYKIVLFNFRPWRRWWRNTDRSYVRRRKKYFVWNASKKSTLCKHTQVSFYVYINIMTYFLYVAFDMPSIFLFLKLESMLVLWLSCLNFIYSNYDAYN